MQFSPGFLGSFFTGAGNWNITLDDRSLVIQSKSRQSRIEYPSVTSIAVHPGLIWSRVKIYTSGHSFQISGITNNGGRLLKRALEGRISDSLVNLLNEHSQAVRILASSLEEFLSWPKYLSNHDIRKWFARHEWRLDQSVKTILDVLSSEYLPIEILDGEVGHRVERLRDVVVNRTNFFERRNREFVDREIAIHKTYFDSVETSPLTPEQRVASVVMEDRNLLVAAAGSGKTSTVVGKIGYALLRKLVTPEQILVLAFNNHAAKELDERIRRRLGPALGDGKIKVKTFHSMGLEIIAEATGKKPSIANFASGGEVVDSHLISDLVTSLQASDIGFLTQWTLFMCLCRKPARNPAEFASVNEWKAYLKEVGDYHNGQLGFHTLIGEVVKSHGELAIANWLFMHGVQYEYERPYQYETANRTYRQYKPDFYFPEIDCYLEHYALDAKGNPPKAFGDKYRESMEWKRHLHAEKGTDVFESTFAEFIAGTLFDKLANELTQRGIKLKPRSQEELLRTLNQPKINLELSSLLRAFIKHAKSNELDPSVLASMATTMPHPYRAKLFAAIAAKVMGAYEKKLRASGDLDFEDLIIDAANHAASDKFTHPYKLILVDEFQDISRARAKLLLSLLSKVPECQLFAVGDDWQSIYRFAGSDIAIFTGFENTFGFTAVNYLTQTFRSNQGIADLAATFVQRNPSQMKKSVTSTDNTTGNVIAIRQYTRMQEMEPLIEEALAELAAEIKSGKVAKVLILGRYRHQAPDVLVEWQRRFSDTLSIEYRTIHSSKGLQTDYVVLIGLHSGKNAFPSEIADDPLLQMVMPAPETFPHSEERRLFYVALTRARHRVYLLGGKYTPSTFLVEVQNEVLQKQ
jgi:DNA helicase-4